MISSDIKFDVGYAGKRRPGYKQVGRNTPPVFAKALEDVVKVCPLCGGAAFVEEFQSTVPGQAPAWKRLYRCDKPRSARCPPTTETITDRKAEVSQVPYCDDALKERYMKLPPGRLTKVCEASKLPKSTVSGFLAGGTGCKPAKIKEIEAAITTLEEAAESDASFRTPPERPKNKITVDLEEPRTVEEWALAKQLGLEALKPDPGEKTWPLRIPPEPKQKESLLDKAGQAELLDRVGTYGRSTAAEVTPVFKPEHFLKEGTDFVNWTPALPKTRPGVWQAGSLVEHLLRHAKSIVSHLTSDQQARVLAHAGREAGLIVGIVVSQEHLIAMEDAQ